MELSLCSIGKKVSPFVKPGIRKSTDVVAAGEWNSGTRTLVTAAIPLKRNGAAKEERGMTGDFDAISDESAEQFAATWRYLSREKFGLA